MSIKCSECGYTAQRFCLKQSGEKVPFCEKCAPRAKFVVIDHAAERAKVRAACARMEADYAAQGLSAAAVFNPTVKAVASVLEAQAERLQGVA